MNYSSDIYIIHLLDKCNLKIDNKYLDIKYLKLNRPCNTVLILLFLLFVLLTFATVIYYFTSYFAYFVIFQKVKT